MKKEFPFKIGADPEFNIMLGENRIPANRIIQILFKNQENSDNRDDGYQIKNAGELGWDGHSITGEIRPSPAYTPNKLIQNIRELFTTLTKKSQLLEISTKSDKAPVGGHIHFELPENLASKNTAIKNIHKKMALFYIPVMIGEDLVNSRIRIKHGYGKLDDYNTQETDNENEYTYEFRCPNAEWLTTPKIAQATIAYMATVYNEIINHQDNINETKDILIQNQKQILAIQELAFTQYTLITKSILTKIRKYIKTFEYYETYKEEINYIFTPQKILRDKEKVNFEITNGWKLTKNKAPNKKDLMSEKKMKELSKKISIDEIAGAISVPYNPDDSKCVDFAKALKDRIIAYSWKLNHNYFIFGLRKDIKNYIVMNGNHEILEGEDIITQSDLYIAEEMIQKMIEKYKIATKKNIINKEELKKLVLIGIPYEKRIDLETKEFITKIYEIEHNKEKVKTEKEIKKIINNNKKEKNILSKICNGTEEDRKLITESSRENQIENERQTIEIQEEIRRETNENEEERE